MKLNKKIFICALLVLVMLCAIGTASAEDTLNQNLTDTGGVIDDEINEELGISDSENELSAEGDTIIVDGSGGGDYATISEAVGAATGGETIYIKNGEYSEGKIETGTKQLSFVGESQEGVILKSTGSTGFFGTTESGYNLLSFSKLTFKDINAGSSAAINIGGNGNVNILNCTFDSCYSRYGSIRLFTSGMAVIEDCKIINSQSSTSSFSSAIDCGGSGTNPYFIKNTVISNSSMKSTSSASYIFGMIYNEGGSRTLTLANVTISNCSCEKSSGLISTKGNLVIKNSKFTGNVISRDGIYGFIFTSGGNSVTIQTTQITNNTGSNYLLTTNSASASYNLTYNNIQDNTFKTAWVNPSYEAYSLDANYWGSNTLPDGINASTWIVEDNGVYKLNTGEEIDVTIPGLNDNSEPVSVDAIYVSVDGNDENNGSADSPVFNITKAIELAKSGSGNVIIKEGTYSQSGIEIDNEITIIGEGNVVIDCTGLDKASVFTVTTTNFTMKNIDFANLYARYGGALFIKGSSQSNLLDVNVVVENCSFNNATVTRGGAIYAYYTKGTLKVSDCEFTNMDVTWGAICAYQSSFDGGLSIELYDSIFANNTANNAAALYIQASNLSVNSCEFYNNTAAQSPGAIYLTNVTATFDNCKIYNNSASKEATAISVYAGKISSNPTVLKASEITMTNCIIENNNADNKVPAIAVFNSNLDISYSVLNNEMNINNTVVSNYDGDKPGNVTANNNWWGVDNPAATVEGENIVVDRWVILNLQANASEVLVGDTVKITIDLDHVNTTSGEIEDLTGGVIPKTFTVTLSSTSGSIEPASVEITQGTSKDVIYTVADVDAVVSVQCDESIKTMSFAKGVEPYYGVIYVSKDGNDKNNGSEEYPVFSISKAVELALVSGGSGEIIVSEGTYAGADYHVTGDLKVTGIGNVILDGENQSRIFYMEYSDSADKLELVNLTITGAKHNYGAVVYNRAKELILDNITVIGSTGAGNLIYTTGKMTIKDSEISNHNGGNVIATSGNYDLIINNTVFKNNTVTASISDYGIVYISSGSGDITIVNSKFIDSTTRQGVIVARSCSKTIDVTSCEFINNHMQDTYASGGAISANNKLTVTDSLFVNNTACGDGGAITIGSYGDATITKSVFINNSAASGKSGDAIYNSGKLTVNYCVLLSNANNKVIYHEGEVKANLQYNWWGTNDDPASLVGVGTYEVEDDSGWDYIEVDCEIDLSKWVVMTVSNNMTESTVNLDDQVEFTVDFTHDNTGAALADSIPEVDVSASAVNGGLDSQMVSTENGQAKFVYTSSVAGEDTVTITSSNAVNETALNVKEPVILDVIYVSMSGNDENNGSSSSPVATLKHAIEIAEKGKIVIMNGDYTITETLVIDKDLDIEGRGTVTINGNQLGIFENNANLNLTNIAFTNAKLATGSVIKDNGNTTIDGCTFFSCVTTGGSSAGPINNMKGTMVINNSKFYENKGARGIVASQIGTKLIINNSEFYDNDCTSITTNGIIYSASAETIVENTLFRNNKVKAGAGIYSTRSSSASTGSLEVNNCTFENNIANYGNGGAVFVSGSNNVVNIKNSKFISNMANASANNVGGSGAAIYMGTGTSSITVTDSLFINNTANSPNYADAGIYVGAGSLDISNSVILVKDGETNFALNNNGATVNANDNFWGDNTKANTNANVASWIILDASYTTSEDGTLTITAAFDKTNSTDGSIADYAGSIPDGFDVTFTSTSGNLNEVVPVKDGQASVTYTRDPYTDTAITVKAANAEVTLPFAVKPSVIYVSTEGNDNNDGSADAPVATLQKAVELAEKGEIVILEGTYKTGNLGSISSDLTITGEGKVIIDAENSNRILYVGTDAKVVLKNLVMINGYTADESGALLGNSNELTLINCTLANSSAGQNNGGAIYNVGKLTIINSTIANNTAREGGAIFTNNALAKGAEITIENSIIENNVATGNDNLGGGAIFAQQITALTIKNTTFENNEAQTSASGGAIFISHSTASMTIDDSRFIANHANGQEDVGGGAIYMAGTSNYERQGTLTISNTLFEDNSADYNGGAIYSRATTVNVEKSVFINNTDANGLAIYGYKTEQVSPSITANENWWGANDDPSELVGGNSNYKPTVSNWALLTISNDTEIKDGNTVKLTVAIDSITDGETVTKLDNPIDVAIPVTISTNKGDIEGVLTDGEFTYDLDATGIKYVALNIDGEEEVLFVNTVETTVAVEDITASKGDHVEYTVTVTSADGTVVNKGTVELYIDDELIAEIDVENGIAKETIVISQDVGKHNITVNYVDETEQFGESEANKTLTVTGINNIVTPETFHNFFDENNVLKDDIPFDEIIFQGTFDNIGVITVNKAIKLTGDNAVFNNASFKLSGEGVELSNVNIVTSKSFDETDGAAVYIGGNNVVVSNSNITYNAPDSVQSYAISVDVAKDVKITNNNIKYTAESDGTVQTMAVKADESDNLVFENNVVDANIPSVDIDYSAYPKVGYLSQGVHIENSNNVSFNKNNVTVSYSNYSGYSDTIYAVHVEGCDDSRITDNGIELNGHEYAYGLVASNDRNVTISGNDIKSVAEGIYAAGLQVSGESNGTVSGNTITAKATNVTYPVYLDDWGGDSEVNLVNNTIKGESNTVYGVYVEENKSTIADNTIDVKGDHVYGIVTHQTDVVIDGNDISANGTDIGPIDHQQSGVNENTTGIIVSEGSAQITNNNVVTTGKSTIAAVNTNATIKNNGLTSNGTTADDSISNIGSNVTTSGNTEAKDKSENTTPVDPVDPVTPTKKVIKISAKNNAKVDYGYKYKVRVTLNGKTIGAGKKVTLKIAGKTIKAKTNKKGYAYFKLAVKPKKYTAKITYGKVTKKVKITVKNVIKAKNVKIKKSAKKVRIKVALKTSKKKPIKGKKVTLKIKGKKVKAKTNKKGVATFKIKKSILKKLKVGKKYKYLVIYGKDKVKKTVKVKR